MSRIQLVEKFAFRHARGYEKVEKLEMREREREEKGKQVLRGEQTSDRSRTCHRVIIKTHAILVTKLPKVKGEKVCRD